MTEIHTFKEMEMSFTDRELQIEAAAWAIHAHSCCGAHAGPEGPAPVDYLTHRHWPENRLMAAAVVDALYPLIEAEILGRERGKDA